MSSNSVGMDCKPTMTGTGHAATDPAAQAHARSLAELLAGRQLAVLTGAGCSTESGIPDYRGPETRRRARKPMRFAEFMRDAASRKRYWARALVGYGRFRDRAPNPAHLALADLERAGQLTGLVTQNVDGLHERAGSQRVVALHGSLAWVRCLDCERLSPRDVLQQRLANLNPGLDRIRAELAPDGDAELPPQLVEGFQVAACEACSGPLKPWVVFFGENVPPARVQQAHAICDAGDALLVVGSSLAVYSGLRFVRRAADRGVPIAILNLGETRGDPLASLRVDARAGLVLPQLARIMSEGER